MAKKETKSEKEQKRIQDEFDMIKNESSEFDISNHLATFDMIPDLGEIEIYDYDADITVSSEKAIDVLESLVDLYLGDLPQVKQHSYIRNKMAEDASVYAEALFLSKMTRKNFLTQLRQVDNGDDSARMHEVVNQTIGQIRENSKFLGSQRSTLEKFYKELRNDLGYDEAIMAPNNTVDEYDDEEETTSDDGAILNQRDLNDMIKNAMLNKKDDEGKKKKR